MFFPVLVVSPDGAGRCQGNRGGLLLQESDGDLSVVQRRHPQAVTGEEESVPPPGRNPTPARTAPLNAGIAQKAFSRNRSVLRRRRFSSWRKPPPNGASAPSSICAPIARALLFVLRSASMASDGFQSLALMGNLCPGIATVRGLKNVPFESGEGVHIPICRVLCDVGYRIAV